jgi:hypothetical protein
MVFFLRYKIKKHRGYCPIKLINNTELKIDTSYYCKKITGEIKKKFAEQNSTVTFASTILKKDSGCGAAW